MDKAKKHKKRKKHKHKQKEIPLVEKVSPKSDKNERYTPNYHLNQHLQYVRIKLIILLMVSLCQGRPKTQSRQILNRL